MLIYIIMKFFVYNYGYLKFESLKRGGNRKVFMVYKFYQLKLGYYFLELFLIFFVEG